jgi:hypothetical protein
VRKLLAAFVLLLALAGSAQASGGVVPASQQQQIKLLLAQFDAGDLAYVPSKAPKGYVVGTTSAGPSGLGLTLVDVKYVDSTHSGGHAILFASGAFTGKAGTCSKGSRKTLRIQGKTVYWNGGDVTWRCLRAPSGRVVKVSVASIALSRSELGLVTASISRIP